MFSESDSSSVNSEAEGGAERQTTGTEYYPLGTRQRQMRDAALLAKREMLLQHKRNALYKDCTFQPMTNTTQQVHLMQPASVQEGQTAQHEETAVSVFDRLARNAAEREERLQARRHESKMREEQMLRSAQFRPTINKKTSGDCSPPEELAQRQRVEDRLLQQGYQSEQLRRQRQIEAEQRTGDLADHGDSVNQNSATTRTTYTYAEFLERKRAQLEFEKRNNELLERREQSRIAAMEEELRRQPFHPKISETSEVLDLARTAGGATPAPSRCSAAGAPTDARRAADTAATTVPAPSPQRDRAQQLYERAVIKQRSEAASAPLDVQPARVPKVNGNSEKWIENGPHKVLFQHDFVRRQEIYNKAKEEQLKMLQQQVLEREEELRRQSAASTLGRERCVCLDEAEIAERVERLYRGSTGSSPSARVVNDARRQSEDADHFGKPRLSPGTEAVLRKMKDREPDVVRRLTKVRPPRTSELYESQPSPAAARCRSSSATAVSSTTASPSPTRARFHVSRKTDDIFQRSASTPAAAKRASSASARSPDAATVKFHPEAFYRAKMEQLEKRDQVLQQMKKQELMAEMAACTFRPATNIVVELSDDEGSGQDGDDGRSHTTERLQEEVQGVDVFLRRQEQAKRLRAEQEERERRVAQGRSAHRRSPPASRSHPLRSPSESLVRPFHLETEERHQYQQHIRPQSAHDRHSLPSSSHQNHKSTPQSLRPAPIAMDESISVTANLRAYRERRLAATQAHKQSSVTRDDVRTPPSLFSLNADERDMVQETKKDRLMRHADGVEEIRRKNSPTSHRTSAPPATFLTERSNGVNSRLTTSGNKSTATSARARSPVPRKKVYHRDPYAETPSLIL